MSRLQPKRINLQEPFKCTSFTQSSLSLDARLRKCIPFVCIAVIAIKYEYEQLNFSLSEIASIQPCSRKQMNTNRAN